jgi:hypothetical protein
MAPKFKNTSDNESRRSCKVMALDEDVMVLGKLRGGMNAAAVGQKFTWYFTFNV